MKKYFELVYWSSMVVVLSLVTMSVMGSFPSAFFLSVMLLPGIMFVKYFLPDISFRDRRKGILDFVWFLAAAFLIEYLAVMFVLFTLFGGEAREFERSIIMNPFFLCFVLGSLLAIEKLIKIRFFSGEEKEQFITFTSERVRISLELSTILYIESRDDEVLVVTSSGRNYPTRMKISQWETVLDDRFLRVHRSFIVNREHVTGYDTRAVSLGEIRIEISRKYKESVADRLR